MTYFERRLQQCESDIAALAASIESTSSQQTTDIATLEPFRSLVYETALPTMRSAVVAAARKEKKRKAYAVAVFYGAFGLLIILVAAVMNWAWQARIVAWLAAWVAPLIGFRVGGRISELIVGLDDLAETTVIRIGVRTAEDLSPKSFRANDIAVFAQDAKEPAIVDDWRVAPMPGVAVFVDVQHRTSTGQKPVGILSIADAEAASREPGTLVDFPPQDLLKPFSQQAIAALRELFLSRPEALRLLRVIAQRAGALQRMHAQKAALLNAVARNAQQSALWSEIAIRDVDLERLLRSAEALVMADANAPRGILLFGPPGTGKTLIARCLAQSAGCAFIATSINDFKGKFLGHSEDNTAKIWAQVRAKAPCILFIDECDAVLGTRDSSIESDKFDAAITNAFIQHWDGMADSSGVMVIGATNRKQVIDDAALSRFAISIRIDLPGTADRVKIINARLRKNRFDFAVGDAVGRATAGLSGRDLDNGLKQFAMEWQGQSGAGEEQLTATFASLRSKTSNLRSNEVFGWESLVASSEKKRDFQRVASSLRSAEQMRANKLSVPSAMLLYGPPGTGKTQVARILASESGLTFFKATTSDLKAAHTGHSGNKLRQLFDRARASAPAMLFIDEIDIVAPRRGDGDSFTSEIVGELLQQMSGIDGSSDIFVLAASNAPDAIDTAIMSRFQTRIELPLPTPSERIEILKSKLAKKPCEGVVDETHAMLGLLTEGMSGRDLESVIHRAEGFAVDEVLDRAGDPEHAVIRPGHLMRAAELQMAIRS